jgi:uncharacterized membrane protein YeaQ/YmgE (transglycosylase-associated protein family)
MKIISILLFLGTVIPILGMLIFDWNMNIIMPVIASLLGAYITVSILYQLNKNDDENT